MPLIQEDIPNSKKKEEDTNSVGYVFSSPVTFQKRLISLNEHIERLKRDKESAENLGLKGVANATEAEIQVVEAQIHTLQARINIIEHGYEFLDRIGFIMACEACNIFDMWHCIGNIANGNFIANEDVDIKIPQEVLQSLKNAIETGLFKSFIWLRYWYCLDTGKCHYTFISIKVY